MASPKTSEGGQHVFWPPKGHEFDHEWESHQEISSSFYCFVVSKSKILRVWAFGPPPPSRALVIKICSELYLSLCVAP